MIDPEHLNDLKEMVVGQADRAAFLHAASRGGYPERLFDPLHLDLYTLLVMVKGQECTDRDVSSALWVAMQRAADERDPQLDTNIVYGNFEAGEDVDDPPLTPIPIERFVREAAIALDSLNRYEGGDRVRIGRDRATAVSAVIVGRVSEDWWLVTDQSGGALREVDFGEMWHTPLAQPTPLCREPDP